MLSDSATLTAAPAPRRPTFSLPLLGLAVLLAVIGLAASVGAVPVSLGEVVGAVWRGLTGELSGPLDTIIWQLRLPRVLLAALVGGSLALAGVAYQGLFRNPLADPYLLGVASGAGFGASVVLAFSATVPLLAQVGVPLVAFLCALAAALLVTVLAKQGGGLPLVALILAGLVVGSILTAATSLTMLAAREQAAGVLAWLLGSFAFAGWAKLASALPLVLVAAVVIWLSARALNLLALGEEQAAQLGLPVEAFKLLLIGAATLVTAAAVSVAGVIGFVGLMVPHAVRLWIGADHYRLIPLACLAGAVFMVLADLLARTVIAPAELPVGVITALVGGPFFLAVLRRSSLRQREG